MRSGFGKCSWWLIPLAAGLVLSGCRLVPGTEAEMPDWSHRLNISLDGEAVTGKFDPLRAELYFTASRADLGGSMRIWENSDEAVENKAPIRVILPSLHFDVEDLNLDDQDRLCLKDPIRFFDPDTLEEVGEIEAGTCLEDGGETDLAFETG